MSTRFTDNVSVICADFLNEVDDILIALCNASTKEEVQQCLDMLTSSELAQTYLALDGSNRMTAQLSLQGDAPVEDFHAAPKSWIDGQIAAVNQLIGFARRDETQVAHGFTAGQPVYWDGIEWQLAIATGLDTAGTHVVSFVVDDDSFQVAQFGWIENLPPATLTPGAIHYVSDTVAGTLTLTEPAFSNPIFLGISDTLGWVISQRAIPSGGLDYAIQSDYDTGEAGKSVDPALGNANYLTKSLGGDNGQDQIVQLPITLNELKDTEVQGATNTITLRTSITPAEVPTLVEGEAELNIPDEILHVGDNVGGTIPFNKNPVAAPVEHADTLNRDADDCHPIVAITGLQADLEGRYTSAEVDGLIAGLQSQIDLQPTLIEDVDITGRNLNTDPLVFDLDIGYAYEISGFVRTTPEATSLALRLSNPDDSIIISNNYRWSYQRYGSVLNDSSGSNVASTYWFLTTSGFGAATVFKSMLNLDASLLSNCVFSSQFGGYDEIVGYLTGTAGGGMGNISAPVGGRINVLTINPGVTMLYGRIQVYRLPKLPTS